MKKFKTAFYILYIAYFLFAGFIALNYESLVLRWDWDTIDTWVGLLKFVLKMGGLGLLLFFIEIVVENIHILSLNRKIKNLEGEVQDLKAKLYDNTQVVVAPPEPEPSTTTPPDESAESKPPVTD